MKPDRITVYLPCHSLHDFPTWLEEAEADALLSAWTAAWHPWLIATVGAVPRWASVDLPPAAEAALGIVPAPWDDRFALQADAIFTGDSRWVRGEVERARIVAAAESALTGGPPAPESRAGADCAEDFHALGLAVLLSELLAQRMRSSTVLEGTGFDDAALRAARAAIAGDEAVARAALRECYSCLDAARARYYPVDVWLLDVILLADSTLGDGIDRELSAAGPAALVATGALIEKLAARNPAALARLREKCAAGTLAPAGGRYDSLPLDTCTPEQLAASFERGMAAWREHVGVAPVTYAQQTGGSSAILPQLLAGRGFAGVLWTLYDGTPLPDPAASRIRWEGTGGGCIDGVARPPLDARSARTILALPERIGDAMDHDHTAVIQFAHHAGTASPWFDALRRIGAAGTALGTFVTPPDFFARTAGAGTVVSFEPDAFPVGLPQPAATSSPALGDDPVASHVSAARNAAHDLLAAEQSRHDLFVQPAGTGAAHARLDARGGGTAARSLGTLFGFGHRRDASLVLEHELLRIEVHRETGGLLSVRRPTERGNRLSQRLALRSTRPPPAPGKPWEDPSERAVYSHMEADTIERLPAAGGRGEAIVSRGRLTSPQRRDVGVFTQRVELVSGLPLALIDVDVRLADACSGSLFEHHAACRFAWNENEDVEVRRSLHTQSIVTERGRFTAPWFMEVGDDDDPGDRVAILTGGLPWHVRSSPHMVDSILPPGMTPHPAERAACRLAVGIGVRRPWDLAIRLLAEPNPAAWTATLPPLAVPPHVRVTAGPVRRDGERIVAARIGLLESAGTSGPVRLEFANLVTRAHICGVSAGMQPTADSSPVSSAGEAEIDGRVVKLQLRRYQWLQIDVEFTR
jgi:hypothetical protein